MEPRVDLTGEIRRDMEQLRDHYAKFGPKFPAMVGPVCIRQEEASTTDDEDKKQSILGEGQEGRATRLGSRRL